MSGAGVSKTNVFDRRLVGVICLGSGCDSFDSRRDSLSARCLEWVGRGVFDVVRSGRSGQSSAHDGSGADSNQDCRNQRNGRADGRCPQCGRDPLPHYPREHETDEANTHRGSPSRHQICSINLHQSGLELFEERWEGPDRAKNPQTETDVESNLQVRVFGPPDRREDCPRDQPNGYGDGRLAS
jgi:hypothetical protein